jgi:AbrB family looped-hinge helix DNA binding protein
MTVARISSKGWIVIPADLRRKYALVPGEPVQIVDYGGIIAIVPTMADPVEQSAGMLKGERSLQEALLAERAVEREREG